ncbi:hypothetical protein SAMN05192566_1037 [Methylophilus rhizosphaerae]|uniref:Wyosine [tRNA(Phe)-imidazoG37] synthetase, radical SAM superfamily n=1 Tax=Methylophilus rhizosphaerae TaxID=492660 RepID=A0A1G9B836_9PROT|nr:hypothetical protein [Methylophilus rhizosphaerae]SDK35649.1 hypothetical protein SAMN05192566_1037 [Methylophilus rhizosphaerae]
MPDLTMQARTLFDGLAAHAGTRQWRYVYPVWSRRAQGISIGINLHPNHCCNWHCIYCQVPGLQRGPSPVITISALQHELQGCLDWLHREITAHGKGSIQALVQDIAFAGDGEPTTSPQFAEAMLAVHDLLCHRAPEDKPRHVRLITNGSQCQHAHVQHAIRQLHMLGGEVWFKLDAGSDEEMLAINDSRLPLSLHLQRLKTCCSLCQTWVQTAILCRRIRQQTVTTPSLPGYLQALHPLQQQIKGILLYSISRPSQQDTTGMIQVTPEAILKDYAEQIRTQGFHVCVFN